MFSLKNFSTSLLVIDAAFAFASLRVIALLPKPEGSKYISISYISNNLCLDVLICDFMFVFLCRPTPPKAGESQPPPCHGASDLTD